MRRFYVLALGLAGSMALVGSAEAQLKTTPYVTGLSAPVAIIQDPAFPDTQYVIQQRGLIRTVQNGVIIGDAMSLVGIASTSGSERGLLGMAFHPNYPTVPFVYLNYTAQPTSGNHPTRIVRYTRNSLNPRTFDLASATQIIQIAQDFSNHNGGTLRFGPDGYLYIGMGDGGSANDPNNRAQSATSLLGKMLRLDINSDAFPADNTRFYAIPPGQPFTVAGGTLAQEVWSFGIRNPWKWSFDNPALLGTGAMLMGDVGQDAWEEVNYEPAGQGGRNYGWRVREGLVATSLTGQLNTNYVNPIWVYSHSVGISITGGYVYRGTRLGDGFGRYFFADYAFNRIWSFPISLNGSGEALPVSSGDVIEHSADLNLSGFGGISSIDVNSNGELFVVDYGGAAANLGRVFRIEPENRYEMMSYNLLQASDAAGQIRGLLSADTHFVRFEPDYAADTVLGDGGVVRAVFQARDVTSGTFTVRVRARTNQPTNQPALIGVRNRTTNRIDWVLSSTVGSTYTNLTTTALSAATYRSAGGEVEVYASFPIGTISFDPFETRVDQIQVNP